MLKIIKTVIKCSRISYRPTCMLYFSNSIYRYTTYMTAVMSATNQIKNSVALISLVENAEMAYGANQTMSRS